MAKRWYNKSLKVKNKQAKRNRRKINETLRALDKQQHKKWLYAWQANAIATIRMIKQSTPATHLKSYYYVKTK